MPFYGPQTKFKNIDNFGGPCTIRKYAAGRGAGLLLRPPPGSIYCLSRTFVARLIPFQMQKYWCYICPLPLIWDVTPPPTSPSNMFFCQNAALLFLFWIAKPGDWQFQGSDTVLFPISILIDMQSASPSFQNSLHGPRTHRIMSHALRAVRGHWVMDK